VSAFVYRTNAYRRPRASTPLRVLMSKPMPFKSIGYAALLAANVAVLVAESALEGGRPPLSDETPVLSISNAPRAEIPEAVILYNATPVYGAPAPWLVDSSHSPTSPRGP
jgi:hypothetical protein